MFRLVLFMCVLWFLCFFFSSRRRHTRCALVTGVQTCALSDLAEVSQEMMSFANVRLRAEMECAEDFAKANSPEDLFEKQCSFARQAARQYAEETSKLIGMFARIQQSCWAPMEACTKAALHGIDGAVDGEEKK